MSSLDDVSVKVLDTEYETMRGYHISPAPSPQTNSNNFLDIQGTASTGKNQNPAANEHDEKIYTRDAFYPGALAELGYTGYLRDQPHDLNRIPESPLINGDSGGCYQAGQATLPKNAPAIKIGIIDDGIYKITYQYLVNGGLKVNDIDPRKTMIQNRGKEVRILVSGEDDGVFYPDDYILFYGVSNKDIYTKQNVYWLKISNKRGKWMMTKNGDIFRNRRCAEGLSCRFPCRGGQQLLADDSLWVG